MAETKITRELLLRVAENARLKLSEKEIKKFLAEMQEILKAFSQIDEVDVSAEQPSFQPVPLKNVFREDRKEKCLSQEQALSNTKHKKNGYFIGPKVV